MDRRILFVAVLVVTSAHLFSELVFAHIFVLEVLWGESLKAISVDQAVFISDLHITIFVEVVVHVHCLKDLATDLFRVGVFHVIETVISVEFVKFGISHHALHEFYLLDDAVSIEISIHEMHDCFAIDVVIAGEAVVHIVEFGELELKLRTVTPIEVVEVLVGELKRLLVTLIGNWTLVVRCLGVCCKGG